jgi:hypothetical protein
MVLQSFFLIRFLGLVLSGGKKQLFYFFSVGLCVGKKINVLFVRLAFFSKMLIFNSVSALCTTCLCMILLRRYETKIVKKQPTLEAS